MRSRLPATLVALLPLVMVAAACSTIEARLGRTDQLMEPPEPVPPVATVELVEVGGTEWRFDNGAIVRFVPFQGNPGEMTLVSRSSGGWSVLEPDDAALAGLAVEAVAASGIGPFDRDATREYLQTRALALGPYILEAREGFEGNAATDDLESLFQQLHLSYTDPRIDPDGLTEALERGERLRRDVATVPDRALDDAVFEVQMAGDVRFSVDPPVPQGLDEARALALYQARFDGVHDAEIALVGDADVAVVADLAARYIGTLPAGEPDTFRDVRPPFEPPDEPLVREVADPEGSVLIRIVQVSPQLLDPAARVELQVLAAVVEARLLSLQQDEAAVVAPDRAPGRVDVEFETEKLPWEGVRALIEVETSDERAVTVVELLMAELDELAVAGPSAAEVAEAVAMVRAVPFPTNLDLITMLLVRGDEPPTTVERRSTLLDALDPEAVAQRAAVLLDPDTRFIVRTANP